MSFKENFIVEVNQVFENTSYPVAQFLVKPWAELQDQHIASVFRNRDWKTLTQAEIQAFVGELPVFSDEAFVYFMPSFLTNLEVSDGTISELLYYNFVPPTLDNNLDFDKRMKLFSLPQRKVIKKFITYFLEEEPYFANDPTSNRTRKYWDKITEENNDS